jgi:tetratricopeptide (TPR) repeat protein
VARLTEELAHCWCGSVCFVVLEGEPGIGKTRLAVELAQRAAGSGAVTLYGRCDEEPTCSYQPFVEALHAYVAACPPEVLRSDLAGAGPEVLRLVPQLHQADEAPPVEVVGDPDGDRYRLFASFAALVSTVAARTPVVLIVDDLHWADQSTLLMLRHLLRAPLSRVMVVVTLRTTEDDDELVDSVIAGSHRECCVSRVHLEGLESEAVGELVFSLTRHQPGASEIGDLRHRTGGNPLFIREVSLEALACGLPPGAGSPLPQGVKDGIRHRLRRLSPTTKRWLDAAAVAGERFVAPVVGRLLELSEEELLEALEESLAAEVVTTVPGSIEVHRFTHALVREVLYAAIDRSRRARLHRDLARIVEQVGASPGGDVTAEVAHHMSAAARAGVGDAAEAGAWAARAAERAMAQLSYEGAAAHLENALSLTEVSADAEERCALLLRLGEASSRSGDLQRSRRAFEEAAALARGRSPEQLARAAVGYCGVSELGMADQPDDVAWCLLEEANRVTTSSRDLLRVQLLSRLAREAHYRQDRERCLVLGREVIALAAAVGDPRAEVIALFNRRWRFAGAGELQEQLDASSQLLDRTSDVEPGEVAFLTRRFRVGTLLELGDVAGVRGEVEACRVLARRLRQPLYEEQVRRFDTMLALLDGRFDDVRSLLATPPPQPAPPDVSVVANQLLILWWLTGGLEGAAEPAAAMAADRPWLPVYQAASALIEAELGHTEAAAKRFDRFVADQLPDLPDDETWLLTLTLLAYAAARLDRPAACVQLRRLLQPHARRTVVLGGGDATLGSAGLAVGGLLIASDEPVAAVRQLEAALDDNERLEARPFVVLTRLELGRLLRQAPDRRAAMRGEQLLEAALTEARLLDMAPAVGDLERLLG